MKHLRSNSADLRRLFGQEIDVSYIGEALSFCSPTEPASSVRNRMEQDDFDVMGVRSADEIEGYLLLGDLQSSDECGKFLRIISHYDLISSTTPLIEVLPLLKDREWVFLLDGHEITAIVTRSDLQKTPVRLLIFGMISLLEMNLQRLIRSSFQGNDWESVLSPGRLEKARQLHRERKQRNEAIGLLDCLQLCDKRVLIAQNEDLVRQLGFPNGRKLRDQLADIEKLRDKVAHSQDLITGSNWEEVIGLIAQAELLNAKLEAV